MGTLDSYIYMGSERRKKDHESFSGIQTTSTWVVNFASDNCISSLWWWRWLDTRMSYLRIDPAGPLIMHGNPGVLHDGFNMWSGNVSCLFILEAVLVWLIETEKLTLNRTKKTAQPKVLLKS